MTRTFERNHAHCACAGAGFSAASTKRKYERSRPFVVKHLALDLDVSFEKKAVSGSARLDFSRRAPSGKALVLDAVHLELHGVRLSLDGGAEITLLEGSGYSYDGEELSVPIAEGGQSGTLVVDYRAVPQVGLYFLEPDEQVPDRPRQLWSQCQDEDGRHWFPCQDKPHVKMTTEITVRVPSGMTALSNGALLEKKTPKNGSVWSYHYRLDEPHPAYLITLVVGHFDEWSEDVELPSGRVIPLRYLVEPGKKADGVRAFAGTGRTIQLFSDRTGVEYPWDRYTQIVVSDFIFGGMENTTATTMYEHILLDEKATLDIESHDLVAHELAHQWFGDLVTCRDWSHAWLNEGFATYMELVERESRLGRDEYEQGVTDDLEAYLGEAHGDYQRAIVCRDYEEPIDLFDRHLYQKGGLVLHMLRQKLGTDVFWAAVGKYLRKHRGSIVETRDLILALEEESGLSLEKFFDQWVYRAGHPELDVKVSYDDGSLVFDVDQTQGGDDATVFEFGFEVDVCVDGQWTHHRRNIDERKSALVVHTGSRPTALVIDPDFTVTAPIKLTGPADILRNSLREAPTARGRAAAANALRRRPDPLSITALEQCLGRENEAWMVRAEAASALSAISGDAARDALLAAQSTTHPKVRRAIVAALGEFRGEAVATALATLASKDESYLVSAAAARSLGKTKAENAPEKLRPLLKKNSWADVIRAGALEGLAASGNDEVTDDLISWSKYGRPLRARRAAIAALGRVGEGRKVREHLVELLRDRDPHLRVAVLGALEGLGDPKARGAIHSITSKELDGRVQRRARKVLASLGSDRAQAIRKNREETERLEKELNELKTRLSRLEQSADKNGKTKVAVDKSAPVVAEVPTRTPTRRNAARVSTATRVSTAAQAKTTAKTSTRAKTSPAAKKAPSSGAAKKTKKKASKRR